MNIRIVRRTVVLAGFLWATLALTAPAQQYGSAISAGARLHSKNGAVPALPFDKGDLSYQIAYQLHDEAAYWRLGLGYAAGGGKSDTVDRVLTPSIHLVFHENFMAIAVGMLKSFISDKVTGDTDTKIYYDLQAGIEIPAGRFRVSAMAIYPFANWSKLTKFSAGDVEYSAAVSFRF